MKTPRVLRNGKVVFIKEYTQFLLFIFFNFFLRLDCLDTEWTSGAEPVITQLRTEETSAATQGVRPLSAAESTAYGYRDEVTSFVKKLMKNPDKDNPCTPKLIVFYKVWCKCNGAFLNMVQGNHATFIDWIKQQSCCNPVSTQFPLIFLAPIKTG